MTVRANWFTDDEVTTYASGAVAAPPVERVQDIGVEFDLRSPDTLLDDVTALLREEADLWEQGITCTVRDRQDTSCMACPFAHHKDPNHKLHDLCRVGREQERICTTHACLVMEGDHQAGIRPR